MEYAGQVVPVDFMDAGNNETVLGVIAKGVPKPQMNYAAHIALREAETASGQPFISALTNFASLADAIIKQFD